MDEKPPYSEFAITGLIFGIASVFAFTGLIFGIIINLPVPFFISIIIFIILMGIIPALGIIFS